MTALFVGLATLDVSNLVDSYPAEDSKTQAAESFIGAGGPAANAAVAHALLGRGRDTMLLTALGNHTLADIVLRDLRSHGVEVVDATPGRRDQPPVSSIVVAAENNTRTIVGLDAARIAAPFLPQFSALIDNASVVLVDAHHPELAVSAARLAQRSGVPVVLDAGRWKPAHADLLPLVDIAICSAAFDPPGSRARDGATELLDYLTSQGVSCAAVTGGADPILYSGTSGHGKIEVDQVDALDTLGAGDILHGAFCRFFSANGDFVESLSEAATVATESTRSFGTRSWAQRIHPDTAAR
ncbi:PfkB family carbohydrate kinase [Nocardia stercoris]|uniref:Sugar kinase n=1 Tax=Nocardia stercoris TaxID=2483361 RepID=A0A3M2L4U6_9NOCA|nr:PfkB family carbohydrate kinase [Nocardia stercoris]RMI32689.1 sugar kinase [Nocardia stercoris]